MSNGRRCGVVVDGEFPWHAISLSLILFWAPFKCHFSANYEKAIVRYHTIRHYGESSDLERHGESMRHGQLK